MARLVLTDKYIISPKRVPPPGKRVEYRDALVPGLALRVTDPGHRSFVLIGRFPPNLKNPTRRLLGEYGAISLEQARDEARAWHALLRKGIDPKVEAEKERAANLRAQGTTFAHVANEYLTSPKVANLAKIADARRIIEQEFMSRWAARPITDIRPSECRAAIQALAKRAPGQAHNAFGYLRRLFAWAINSDGFGIETSPVERLKPKDVIGKRVIRERILTDKELRLVWDAADKQGYAFGSIVKMLILTGQRLNEIARLWWKEVDLDAKLICIPAARMKGDRPHEVPLAPDALALLKSLPRWTQGDFVFSSTSGRQPFQGFGNAKHRFDEKCGVSGWVLHDLRRTARTHFSALPVQDNVRELVIAHARLGLHAVYDQHSYLDEKRECLTLWEARLRGILAPKPPATVADLSAARARRA